jgi:hypothetical protein
LYRGINEFKNGCQPRSNLVKHEKGDHACRFPQHFEPLLSVNVHWTDEIRQTEMCTAEPLVPLRLKWLLKSYNSPAVSYIPEELIQARNRAVCSEIHNIINYACYKEVLHQQRRVSLYLCIRNAIKHAVVIVKLYYC